MVIELIGNQPTSYTVPVISADADLICTEEEKSIGCEWDLNLDLRVKTYISISKLVQYREKQIGGYG